jgi:hypothetical protein
LSNDINPTPDFFVTLTYKVKVGYGSWLGENAKALNRDRRSYSSKTALVVQRASALKLATESKNIILRRVSISAFLHSQGQKRRSRPVRQMSAYPPDNGGMANVH